MLGYAFTFLVLCQYFIEFVQGQCGLELNCVLDSNEQLQNRVRVLINTHS